MNEPNDLTPGTMPLGGAVEVVLWNEQVIVNPLRPLLLSATRGGIERGREVVTMMVNQNGQPLLTVDQRVMTFTHQAPPGYRGLRIVQVFGEN